MKSLRNRMIFCTVIQLGLGGVPLMLPAQSLLQKVRDRAGQTATNKVLNETDKAVSKGIDQVIESATSAPKDNAQPATPKVQPPATTPSEKNTAAADGKPEAIRSYSRYDFTPGEQVLYANDFEGEVVGELPTGWNTNGNSVIVSLGSLAGKWLRLAQNSVCLTDNEKGFGSDFTVEFDMVLDIDFKGWLPPSLKLGILGSGGEAPASNKLLSDPKGEKSFYVEISPLLDAANLSLESNEKYTRYFNSTAKRVSEAAAWYGKPSHVAIQVQKERLRIWVNEEKYYDAPKGLAKAGEMNQLFFQVSGSSYKEEQIGYFISNIKIAKGLPDLRHKLIQEGSFSTTGILFDSGSSTIRPESAGVLKSIATAMADNPDVAVQIVGHTDSVGEEAANQKLSEQRAAAVKHSLETVYGIAAGRLTAGGKGEAEPVSDNETKEGRLQNRRVEFIKL